MDVARPSEGGWIEVVVGSMFSGKSEELIRRLRRAQIARQRVQIFKPSVDTRYSDNHIVSHSELRIPSDTAKTAQELLSKVKADTEVVGIDEGQFFDQELPAVCNTLADRGLREGVLMDLMRQADRQADPFRVLHVREFRDTIDAREFGIMCLAGFPETEQAAVLFGNALRKIGIETRIEAAPWNIVTWQPSCSSMS